ncbi:MAG: SufD family Fe-S cluster assembly protein [Faecalibacterium sp.]|nr:SufD family Fe-S cluster assembly protein [Faecalibacterium sp.]
MTDLFKHDLLKQVAELDALPVGAYNIRANGNTAVRNTTAHINIVTKTDLPGIDIHVQAGTKNESLHIPVVISESGLKESVYNDFFIGPDCDITIIAGCGIHNCGDQDSSHDGIHAFYVGENSKVRYVEKHYGSADEGATGKRLMNPTTIINLGKNAQLTMETTQISGIDDTNRRTNAVLAEGAKLEIKENLMTTGDQRAVTDFVADLNGEGCSCNIVSRSVAKDNSWQEFTSRLNGNAPCAGHTECDGIIMDKARVLASPSLTANHIDASLIHEAAIGKIAGEQLTKLMTLGLTEAEAEEQIINGFLK